jgi:hypothetical protein
MKVKYATPQAYSERAELVRSLYAKIALPEPELNRQPVARHGILYPHKLEPYNLWAMCYEEPGSHPVIAGIYATEGSAKHAASLITDSYMWHEGAPVATTSVTEYMLRICGSRAKLNSPNAKVFHRGGHIYVGAGPRKIRIDDEKLSALGIVPTELFSEVLLCAGNFEPYAVKNT